MHFDRRGNRLFLDLLHNNCANFREKWSLMTCNYRVPLETAILFSFFAVPGHSWVCAKYALKPFTHPLTHPWRWGEACKKPGGSTTQTEHTYAYNVDELFRAWLCLSSESQLQKSHAFYIWTNTRGCGVSTLGHMQAEINGCLTSSESMHSHPCKWLAFHFHVPFLRQRIQSTVMFAWKNEQYHHHFPRPPLFLNTPQEKKNGPIELLSCLKDAFFLLLVQNWNERFPKWMSNKMNEAK